MKITLDVHDQLRLRASTLAAQQRTTLTWLIEEGLQLRLQAPMVSVPRPARFDLQVFDARHGMV